jgi:hypothetical protein
MFDEKSGIFFNTKIQHNRIFLAIAKIYGITNQSLFYDMIERAAKRILFEISTNELKETDLNLLRDIRRFYFSLVEDSAAMKMGSGFLFIPTVGNKYFKVTKDEAHARVIAEGETIQDFINDRNQAKEI